MSFHLVIADDEYFIRQRIKKIIPWEDETLSLHFAGEAANGQELLDLLKTKPVDIILLDIKMPKMSGLESAKLIYEKYPHIQMIILSGYNDFEYARSAMQFGISHYLLKPVETPALSEALADCIHKIKTRNDEQLLLQHCYHYEMCDTLAAVINKQKTPTDFFTKYPRCNAYRYGLYLGVFKREDSSAFVHSLASTIRSMGLFCEYFRETDYTTSFLILIKDKEELAHGGSFLTELIADTKDYTFITVGNLFSLSDSWNEPYHRVLHLLLLRYFHSQSTLHLEYSSIPERPLTTDFTKLRQKLILQINTKTPEEFEVFLTGLFDDISQKKNIHYMQLLITEIYLTYTIGFPDKIDSSRNITDIISSLLDEEHTLAALQNALLAYGLECMKTTEHAPSDIYLSKKIRSYIEKHYTESALSVSGLAEVFHLNASYMGTLFKKINNQSILQYLIEVRMDAAKELLLTGDYRISDVAELVGYADVFYFSKRFKKVYGSSPKDFLHKSLE